MVSTFSFLGKMEQVFLANSVVASMSLFDVVKLKGLAIVLAKREIKRKTKRKSKNNLIEIKKYNCSTLSHAKKNLDKISTDCFPRTRDIADRLSSAN